MTIKYSGASNYKQSATIIRYIPKEEAKANKIIEALEDNGYSTDLIDCDDSVEIYVSTCDMDEFKEIKEIYLEAKRA